jgi:serine/threonine-protein kinase
VRFTAGGIDYELGDIIDRGGAGIVQKATARLSREQVAVKFLAPHPEYIRLSAFDKVAKRFRDEGMRGAKLQHENLVRIVAYEDNKEGSCFEFAENTVKDSRPFIVMEYIEGETLASFIGRMVIGNPGDVRLDGQTLHIALGVSEALKYLHSYRTDEKPDPIIHRDVKPGNIFLSCSPPGVPPQTVKLGDFGVTKWGYYRKTAESITGSIGGGLGTRKYMSPEHMESAREVYTWSDIYSLGITLYELFTGKILEYTDAERVKGQSVGTCDIAEKLRNLNVTCPTGDKEQRLFELIFKMLLPEPAKRPSSIEVCKIIGEVYEQPED